MFDWFKKREYSNVIKFPEPVKTPYIEPPEPKKESKTYYTFGVTGNNRLAFTMGYTTLTMNRPGVQHLIDQLEFFRDQLHKEDEDVQ
jgi:hypothetical protein